MPSVPALRSGPFQLSGYTLRSVQVATFSACASYSAICAVPPPPLAFASIHDDARSRSHACTLAVSPALIARSNVTCGYVMCPGRTVSYW